MKEIQVVILDTGPTLTWKQKLCVYLQYNLMLINCRERYREKLSFLPIMYTGIQGTGS